jgi:hypothetical protein
MTVNANPIVLFSEVLSTLCVHDVSPVVQKTAANNTNVLRHITRALLSLVTHKGRRFSRRRISDIKRACWNCVNRYGGML